MHEMIEKSIATLKEGVDSLKSIQIDKRDYKAQEARIKALPEEYHFVYEKIAHYMWNLSGGGNGQDMVQLLADLLELFEVSAAQGRHVLSVTGDDVAAFCDELLRNANTYTENWRSQLNHAVQKKVGSKADLHE